VVDPALQEWLNLAPKPAPLDPNQRWHVFISYRSVNRYWVLELYDVLRDLGYSVFLDQYVLAAGEPLATTLGDELDASAAAVLVWSDSYETSEWCKKEFNYLEGRENKKTGFRYVIAKLDSTELPGFASGKIHVDFSQRREGPGGSDVLRMLHGLAGKPLPEAAVKLASSIDEEINHARVQIKAARECADVPRLLELAKSTHLAWLNSPALGCAVAEALIGLKANDAAIEIVSGLATRFPKTARPKQLWGLALARKGDWRSAQTVLGELYFAGEIDPETLGIYARTWKDKYKETSDTVYLMKARDLYLRAFNAPPGNDYYTGINAASTSLLLGEKDKAAQIAERIEKIVGTQPIPDDYWKTATVAEVQLLRANFDKAAELYQAAVLVSPDDKGSLETTYTQAKLLLDSLQATPEQRAKVLAPFARVAVAKSAP